MLQEVTFRLMHRHRSAEFLAHHGGEAARPPRHGDGARGGWSEVYAADGYTLRCEWSRMGSREEVRFTEIAPGAPSAASVVDAQGGQKPAMEQEWNPLSNPIT